jgi:S1-C subfamily serine protease
MKTAFHDFIKLTLAAIVGGGISLGAYTIYEGDKQVIIEKVPYSYSKVASNYIRSEADIIQPDFSLTAEKVTPAVVHIRSTTKARRSEEVQTLPLPFRDFLVMIFSAEVSGVSICRCSLHNLPAQV